MHVRWERRKTNVSGGKAQYELVAFLIEGCLSVENKKVTVSSRLGAIQERFLQIRISKTRAFHHGLFWTKVDRRLRKLRLEKDSIQAIEAKILEKVPRPSEDWALWGVTCIPNIDGEG